MNHLNQTKLGIIGTVGVPACYGGFETLVQQLIPNLNKQFDLTVYCSGKTYPPEDRLRTWKEAKLHYIPLEANGMQSIFYDLWSILHAIRKMDVLLILGVSACLFIPIIKLFSDKKIIVNIDGLEWRRPKWNRFAKKFLLLSENIACRYADEIVTDNRILKEYVKIRYNIKSNLIEYGADHVKKVVIKKADIAAYEFLKGDYAFKVARIEPENNLHIILQAFSELPHFPIVIVGNWDNSQYGKSLRKIYGKLSNIHLLDPIYESRALNVLRSNAKIYIHGHSAGGTNPSLVEAMHLGLPVLSFDVIYNRVTTNNQSFYFSDVSELIQSINNLQQLPLPAVAKTMKEYAADHYTWAVISEKYARLALGLKEQLVPEESASPTAITDKPELQIKEPMTVLAEPQMDKRIIPAQATRNREIFNRKINKEKEAQIKVRAMLVE